jgi:DNA topoisomerase-2
VRGGTHVNYVTEQITEKILETIKKKHKDLNLKPFQIKNHLWIFLNALIENPSFDSQTKETLTTKATNFGSKYELSEKFLKDIVKSGIVEHIVNHA